MLCLRCSLCPVESDGGVRECWGEGSGTRPWGRCFLPHGSGNTEGLRMFPRGVSVLKGLGSGFKIMSPLLPWRVYPSIVSALAVETGKSLNHQSSWWATPGNVTWPLESPRPSCAPSGVGARGSCTVVLRVLTSCPLDGSHGPRPPVKNCGPSQRLLSLRGCTGRGGKQAPPPPPPAQSTAGSTGSGGRGSCLSREVGKCSVSVPEGSSPSSSEQAEKSNQQGQWEPRCPLHARFTLGTRSGRPR